MESGFLARSRGRDIIIRNFKSSYGEKKRQKLGYFTFCVRAARGSTHVAVRAHGIGDRSKEDGGRDNGGEWLGGAEYRQETIKS